MFEKFFSSPKNPEEAERRIQKIVDKELSIGINSPSIFNAFKSVISFTKSVKPLLYSKFDNNKTQDFLAE